MDRFSLALLLSFASLPDPARAEPFPSPVVGVPFGCGLSFPVTQVHAVGTHIDNDVWAWDFRMPEGTAVVAALEGVVRLARGDSTGGGCDPSLAATANYVVLEHAGGLESQYLHFSRVVVSVGQHVKQGELLGYSGATGWACGPHLHFKVARPDSDGWNNPSISARIRGYGDPALGTRVFSPACPGPSVMATGGRSITPAAEPAGGALLPAALAPAASTAPPALTAGARVPSGAPSAAPLPSAGASGPGGPDVRRMERTPQHPAPSSAALPGSAVPAPTPAPSVHAAS